MARINTPYAARAIIHTSLIALLTLGAVGCQRFTDLELSGEARFNDKLRADADALTTLQQQGPAWVERDGKAYYSDGGEDFSELTSELFHSMIDSDRLRELRASDCLFVERDGFPILSFEAIVQEFSVGEHEANLDELGMCGGNGAFNHPVTRELLTVDDEPVKYGYQIPITVALSAYEGNDEARNPYAACDGVRPSTLHSVTPTEQIVDGKDGSFSPFCVIQGSPAHVPDEDVSYVVQVVNSETMSPNNSMGLTSEARELLPHLKLVGGERRIARPLIYRGTEYDDDLERYVHSWSWKVDSVNSYGAVDIAGPFWRENYAPRVNVDAVRFFVQDGSEPVPEHERDYVRVRKLRVVEVGDLGPQTALPYNEGCSTNEAGDPDGDGTMYLEGCNILATPTYALAPSITGRMTEKVEWRASFRTLAANDPVPVQPGQAFFIEFTLSAPLFGSTSASLVLDPGVVDFRETPVGVTAVESSLWIENPGLTSGVVEALHIEGRDADQFAFTLPEGVEPPFVLPAGAGVPVELMVTPAYVGPLQAQFVMESSDAGLALHEAVAYLYANGVAPDLDVLPSHLTFYRGTGYTTSYWQKHFLITNTGSAPLDRGSITIGGANGSWFSVIGSDCGGSFATPAPSTCHLEPGQMETVRVVYHPGQAGVHQAFISFKSDGGSGSVGLTGTCYQGCSYVPTGEFDPRDPTPPRDLDPRPWVVIPDPPDDAIAVNPNAVPSSTTTTQSTAPPTAPTTTNSGGRATPTTPITLLKSMPLVRFP